MIIALNDQYWAKMLTPNLPENILKLYVDLLREFLPQVNTVRGHIQKYESEGWVWNFPFVMTDHDLHTFDYEGYDEWVEYVEKCLIKDYGVSEEMFY